MSRVDMPRAIQRQDLLVKPLKAPLALSAPAAAQSSRHDPGACVISTGPCSVVSVLGVDPLRVFPVPPGGS